MQTCGPCLTCLVMECTVHCVQNLYRILYLILRHLFTNSVSKNPNIRKGFVEKKALSCHTSSNTTYMSGLLFICNLTNLFQVTNGSEGVSAGPSRPGLLEQCANQSCQDTGGSSDASEEMCANVSSCQEKPDVSKLPKLPASSALDPSSMSFGPPRLGPGGGLGTWGRGSGNKKLSVQETAPLKQVNR